MYDHVPALHDTPPPAGVLRHGASVWCSRPACPRSVVRARSIFELDDILAGYRCPSCGRHHQALGELRRQRRRCDTRLTRISEQYERALRIAFPPRVVNLMEWSRQRQNRRPARA